MNVVEERCVPPQVERPALVVGDSLTYAFPTVTVAVEVAVLDLDSGPFGSLGTEADLPLAGLRRVGLDLPVRVDVPAEHHSLRRIVDQDARPVAGAAVDTAVVEAPASAGFDHRLG